jgi:Zn-dependent M28 family amino/carboxypeptidase
MIRWWLAAALLGGVALAASRLSLGASAMVHTTAITNMGPRVPGSPGHERARKYIEAALLSWKIKPEIDEFTAETPLGRMKMYNLIARIPGKSERAVIVAGHYDTKRIPKFLGANDGGSSTGLLLALANALSAGPRRELSVWIIFHDGEEAQGEEWTSRDSLHGSKRMAARLRDSGAVSKVVAMINVDMVGDKRLDLLYDENSTGWLNALVREVAAAKGLADAFGPSRTAIEDDHMPYLAAGIPAVDLIDFHYGPNNSYWHTDKDTLDKLSAASLEKVGRIVLATIEALAKRK